MKNRLVKVFLIIFIIFIFAMVLMFGLFKPVNKSTKTSSAVKFILYS